MAKIIDLGTMIKEPLIFKMPHCEDEFTIPGEVSTQFVFRMSKMNEDLIDPEKTPDDLAKIKTLQRMVIEILKLDKANADKVNMKYINENLDSMTYLRIITEAMTEHIMQINEDENLSSPQSK